MDPLPLSVPRLPPEKGVRARHFDPRGRGRSCDDLGDDVSRKADEAARERAAAAATRGGSGPK
eukprot:13899666-Heterocapsa_arctica.AAC.1